jgi:hypothetical protein
MRIGNFRVSGILENVERFKSIRLAGRCDLRIAANEPYAREFAGEIDAPRMENTIPWKKNAEPAEI